jgi:hypothetical protein
MPRIIADDAISSAVMTQPIKLTRCSRLMLHIFLPLGDGLVHAVCVALRHDEVEERLTLALFHDFG